MFREVKGKTVRKVDGGAKQIVPAAVSLKTIFERCLGELDEEELHRNKSALLIANAQNLIRNNCFDETFSIEVLADSLNISKSYLSKLYKEETGESVWNYVIQVRIARAKELLIHTDDTIMRSLRQLVIPAVSLFQGFQQDCRCITFRL